MGKKNIIAFFSGCGGLDLGFELENFHIPWANEYDKEIWETYQKNHKDTILNKEDIRNINPRSKSIPNCVGIIGGPPCQSWSEAGAQKGINDDRGKLFFEYIKIIKIKKPLFFVAENVPGILSEKHKNSLTTIIEDFEKIGYTITISLVNANDYNVPQTRSRVIIVGYKKDFDKKFVMPLPLNTNKPTLSETIKDLPTPKSAKGSSCNDNCSVNSHEYLEMDFSPRFMSRNRVRGWCEPSFTIQATAKHIPLHPQANKMIKIEKDSYTFDKKSINPYRRLSVRECARIQTFPDTFEFVYKKITAGYKMVGNAVPVNLARAIAKQIKKDLF